MARKLSRAARASDDLVFVMDMKAGKHGRPKPPPPQPSPEADTPEQAGAGTVPVE